MWASIGSIVLALAGCGDSSDGPVDKPVRVVDPKGAKEAPPTSKGSGAKIVKEGPFERSFDGVRFAVPAGWKEVELLPQQQGFIDGRFEIPTPEGTATLTFSSNRAGIESNVRRWIGQFHLDGDRAPATEDITVDGKTAKWIDLKGEFTGGPMASPTSETIERMIGVGIPLEGRGDFYLKLTGSDAAIAKIRDDFRHFVTEARRTR